MHIKAGEVAYMQQPYMPASWLGRWDKEQVSSGTASPRAPRAPRPRPCAPPRGTCCKLMHHAGRCHRLRHAARKGWGSSGSSSSSGN
jgi:hypothetical protein